ncbi:MAG: hypothetical protein NW223_08540 [Hyphomicrobiaceae bacterium]|nr:hypothetical protein [Hyphomicrobiaceae bacterium]
MNRQLNLSEPLFDALVLLVREGHTNLVATWNDYGVSNVDQKRAIEEVVRLLGSLEDGHAKRLAPSHAE